MMRVHVRRRAIAAARPLRWNPFSLLCPSSDPKWAPTSRLVLAALCVAVLGANPARAFEAFDGRLQAHGFFESQLRVLSEDYSEQWDVSQWYQVFNLELELDILPDGFGPIDTLSGYVRAEVRYDCVYTRNCGTIHSVNTIGDRARSLPKRLSNGKENTAAGAFLVDPVGERPSDNRNPLRLDQVAGFSTAAEQDGTDGVLGRVKENWTKIALIPGVGLVPGVTTSRFDDPFPYLFERFDDFRFTQIQNIGGSMNGMPVAVLGPWLPKNFIVSNAGLADRINPFDDTRQSPVVAANAYNAAFKSHYVVTPGGRPTYGRPDLAEIVAQTTFGGGARGYRPIPPTGEGNYGVANGRARGLYLPSRPARELIQSGKLDEFTDNLNFRQAERAWNRGSSQQDEKELKEAYIDVELFESRLWLRLGKQQIVWGKTELFRTTDQFNPQDLALASLPSLEESRIPLWSARATWSFYEVGPFSDVRLEAAMNYDQYESADLGACGEAFTVNLVCQGAFGAWAHSTTGIALLGARFPDDPWNNREGIEFGARLEWRWDRFSFAITDFYGYDDLPYVQRVSTYERNVDPVSGRPRIMGGRSACATGIEDDCLLPGPTRSRTIGTDPLDPNNKDKRVKNAAYRNDPDAWQNVPKVAYRDPNNALLNTPANAQVFSMVCSSTIGVVDLDGSACAQTVFGSSKIAIPLQGFPRFTVGQAASAVFAGQPSAAALLRSQVGFDMTPFLVPLNADVGDLRNPNTTRVIRVNNVDPATGEIVPKIPGLPNKRIRYSTTCLDFNFNPNGIPCGGIDPNSPEAAGSGVFSAAGESLSQHLSPEQEAVLGCGPFFGTNCDDSGIDWLNADITAMVQSFPGFEGTRVGWRTDNPLLIQPGTLGFVGGGVCLSNTLWNDDSPNRNRGDIQLPGCRSPYLLDGSVNPEWRARKDGCIQYDPNLPGCDDPNLHALVQPILEMKSGVQQIFANELAALSWNFMTVTITQDPDFVKAQRQRKKEKEAELREKDPDIGDAELNDKLLRASLREAVKPGQCSFTTPQLCTNIQGVFRLGGISRPDVRAGGNGVYGRRSFQWHNGGELVIRVDKRNVLGFSSDFAIDSLKSNFSTEFTWIPNVPRGNSESWDGLIDVDEYNLTISADRPTFINFLNANRTFFFNTQWFFQYLDGWRRGSGSGPWNVLFTFAVSTGYYQDRLLPTVAWVYDFKSNSGAALPQLTYRYSENFSVTIGANVFMGRADLADMPVNPVALSNRVQGRRTYQDQQENGLAVFRDRDELFLRVRYTF